MELRVLTPEEAASAENLIKEVFFASEEGAEAGPDSSFLALLQEQKEAGLWLGVFDPDLIGAAVFDAAESRILYLCVAPDHRRRGYGKALLNHLTELPESWDAGRILIHSVPSAEEFWTAMGFEETGAEENYEGLAMKPMELLLDRKYLGREVTVCVDHPYGSFHETIADEQYACNCGYVEELADQSGIFRDAYVYGPQEPLEEFKGIVIGLVYRSGGDACRWIVAADAAAPHDAVISAIGFQEQYCDTRILWAGEEESRQDALLS